MFHNRFRQLTRKWCSSLSPLQQRYATSTRLQQLEDTIKSGPCLACGSKESHERIVCDVAQLPLTCSSECNALLKRTNEEIIHQYREIREDYEFSSSTDASKLFQEVLSKPITGSFDTGKNINDWKSFLAIFTDHEYWLSNAKALRLVSVAYSYTLTLMYSLPYLQNSTTGNVIRDMELVILGARAEGTMPVHLWRILRHSPLLYQQNVRIQVHLYGDQLPNLPLKHREREIDDNFYINTHLGLYHDVSQTKSFVKETGKLLAFVLFNPGIGHPLLQSKWSESIRKVFQWESPVLLTAFSKMDQDRDIEVIKKAAYDLNYKLEIVLPPQINTFGNLQYQVDPSDLLTLVQGNARIMIFIPKKQ